MESPRKSESSEDSSPPSREDQRPEDSPVQPAGPDLPVHPSRPPAGAPRSSSRARPCGYDCEFVERPPAQVECECPVCLLVLRDPQQVKCCGHSYCKVCLDRVVKDGTPCPTCNAVAFSIFQNQGLRRTLGGFRVYCSNKDEGCKWVGELGDIERHLNSKPSPERQLEGCLFEEGACVYCTCLFQRLYIHEHQSNKCPKRQFQCEHCGEVDSYENITEIHSQKCPSFPIACHQLCGENVQRQEMDYHVNQDCSMTIVDCDYQEFGCEVRPARKDLPTHITESVADHTAMLAKSMRKVEDSATAQSNALQDNVTELLDTVSKQQTLITSLQCENKELKTESADEKFQNREHFDQLGRESAERINQLKRENSVEVSAVKRENRERVDQLQRENDDRINQLRRENERVADHTAMLAKSMRKVEDSATAQSNALQDNVTELLDTVSKQQTLITSLQNENKELKTESADAKFQNREHVDQLGRESAEHINQFRRESDKRMNQFKRENSVEVSAVKRENRERVDQLQRENDDRINQLRKENDDRINQLRRENDEKFMVIKRQHFQHMFLGLAVVLAIAAIGIGVVSHRGDVKLAAQFNNTFLLHTVLENKTHNLITQQTSKLRYYRSTLAKYKQSVKKNIIRLKVELEDKLGGVKDDLSAELEDVQDSFATLEVTDTLAQNLTEVEREVATEKSEREKMAESLVQVEREVAIEKRERKKTADSLVQVENEVAIEKRERQNVTDTVAQNLTEVEREVATEKSESKKTADSLMRVQQEVADLSAELEDVQDSFASLEVTETLAQNLTEVEREVATEKSENKKTADSLVRVQQEVADLSAKLDDVQDSFESLEVQLETEIDRKMTDFEKTKATNAQWYSQPFYTHTRGYRMCIRVHANGIGKGAGTHISVFLFLMRGIFDDELKWPFQGDITIELVNRLNPTSNLPNVLRFSLTSDLAIVGKVTSGPIAAVGWGWEKFKAHSKLDHNADKQTQHLKHDSLIFRISKVKNDLSSKLDHIQEFAKNNMNGLKNLQEFAERNMNNLTGKLEELGGVENDLSAKIEDIQEFAERNMTSLTGKLEDVQDSFASLEVQLQTEIDRKMTDFEKNKTANAEWYSPPFYTHTHGYKMCINVIANGKEIGKGTHVSVYLVLMPGMFDDDLKWPFQGDITIELVNRLNSTSNLSHVARFSKTSNPAIVDKVISGDRAASGSGRTMFIAHSELTYNADEQTEYLKHDSLIFRISKVANVK